MLVRWTALIALAALPCVAVAQAPPKTDAPAAVPAGASPDRVPTYLIEIVIVEGEEVTEEFSDPSSEDAGAAPGQVHATFSDPEEWKPTAPSAAPASIADALQAEAVTADLAVLPPMDDISGEIISPAPVLPSPAATLASPATNPRGVSLHDRLSSRADVDILSAPTVAVVEKQEASVYVASQQVFDYLVPLGEGKFEVRKTEAYELGIRLNLTVEAGDDAKAVVLSPLQIEVTSLDGREPVTGLNLDAGRPIISTRSLKTSVPIRLGEERALSIPSGPHQQAAMILRIERMEPQDRPAPTPTRNSK